MKIFILALFIFFVTPSGSVHHSNYHAVHHPHQLDPCTLGQGIPTYIPGYGVFCVVPQK